MRPDEPAVIVWRGASRPTKKSNNSPDSIEPQPGDTSDKEGVKDPEGKLRFINTTASARIRDPRSRRLVRSHVMTGTKRRGKKTSVSLDRQQTEPHSKTAASVQHLSMYTPTVHPIVMFGNGVKDYLSNSTFQVGLEGGLRDTVLRHVDTIASAIYPLESYFTYNPFRLVWFDTNMNNHMLFHAALYMSSTYLGLMEGKTESHEATIQMNQAILLINEKLQGPTPDISDNTISAISCLAMGEALLGNLPKWNMHMSGVQRMIEMRGGISTLNIALQMKIYRCDTTGAVNFLTSPHILHQNPSIVLPARPISLNHDFFVQYLALSGVHRELISILQDMSAFSQTVNHAVTQNLPTFEPLSFVQESCTIQQNLLIFSSRESCSAEQNSLHSACTIGALLYMRTILQEFPLSRIGPKNLAKQLRNSLCQIPEYAIPAPIHLWLCFVGGAGLQSSANRSWFVATIVQLFRNDTVGEFRTWDQMIDLFRKLPWIDKLHRSDYQILWEEAEATRLVLFPEFA